MRVLKLRRRRGSRIIRVLARQLMSSGCGLTLARRQLLARFVQGVVKSGLSDPRCCAVP